MCMFLFYLIVAWDINANAFYETSSAFIEIDFFMNLFFAIPLSVLEYVRQL